MTEQQSIKSAPKAGQGILRISWSLFLLFFANLLVGKGNVSFHWGLPQLGSGAEFLLLGAASTMLIWAALKREEAENKIAETELEEG